MSAYSARICLLVCITAVCLIPLGSGSAQAMPDRNGPGGIKRIFASFKTLKKRLTPPPPKALTPAETLQVTLGQANQPLANLRFSNGLNSFPHRYVDRNFLEYDALNIACRAVITAHNQAREHGLPMGQVHTKAREVLQTGALLMSTKMIMRPNFTPPYELSKAQECRTNYRSVQQMLTSASR